MLSYDHHFGLNSLRYNFSSFLLFVGFALFIGVRERNRLKESYCLLCLTTGERIARILVIEIKNKDIKTSH